MSENAPKRGLEALYLECPGMFGNLVSYIDQTLPFHSPHISLPAALSLLAVIKSCRLHAKNYTFPSLFTCVVSPSGSGKTSAHHAIETLLELSNLKSLQGGEPGSDSGILKSIANNPRQLILWDEMGLALSSLSESKNSHESRILSVLMQVYSKTGRRYIGKEYATLERIDISAPYVTIFGASTPIRFFGAINENFIHDGLMPRWICFFEDRDCKRTRHKNPQKPSLELIKYLKRLDKWFPKENPRDLEQLIGSVQPKELRFTKDALDLHKIIVSEFEKKRDKAKEPLRALFWSRAIENYRKVLLCVSEVDTVDYPAVAWASELIEITIRETLVNCTENLRATSPEQIKERFKNSISIGEAISKTELSKRTWRLRLSKRDRDDLTHTLLEAGVWGLKKCDPNDTGRRSEMYFRHS